MIQRIIDYPWFSLGILLVLLLLPILSLIRRRHDRKLKGRAKAARGER